MRTQADIGEIVAKLFDRLPEEFPGCVIEDAMLLVELSEPEDGEDATLVALECTSTRSVVQVGLLEFARRLMFREGHDDADPED